MAVAGVVEDDKDAIVTHFTLGFFGMIYNFNP
jgi:hypothetical protein